MVTPDVALEEAPERGGKPEKSEGWRSILFNALLVVPWLFLVFVTMATLVMELDPKHAFHSFIYALTVCVVCGIPALLVLVLVTVMRGVRLRKAQVSGLSATPRDTIRQDAEFLTPLIPSAEQAWKSAADELPPMLERFTKYAGIYAFCCSSLLLGASCFSASALVNGQVPAEIAYRTYFGYAVASTTVVTFLSDFARMLVRATHRDGTGRMFAAATRRILINLTATSTLVCVLMVAPTSDALSKLLDKGFGWFVVGMVVAILGDRAWTMITERLSKAVAMSTPAASSESDLRTIEGLGPADVERLIEESVDSVHALATSVTPRLYLSTPFPLSRLIDWQDQALLVLRLGARRAAMAREQLGVRGAMELQRLCLEMRRTQKPPIGDLQAALGIPTELETDLMISRLATDATIGQLRLVASSMEGRP